MKHSKGFSLIEVMIVVAIIGIIAAIAYPSYTEYVRKGHRTEIAGMLGEMAQTLERHFTRTGQYTDTATVTLTLPAGNSWYTVTTTRAAASFSLSAAPIAGTMMAGDKCGSFTLTNTGARGNTSNTATSAACWGR